MTPLRDAESRTVNPLESPGYIAMTRYVNIAILAILTGLAYLVRALRG